MEDTDEYAEGTWYTIYFRNATTRSRVDSRVFSWKMQSLVLIRLRARLAVYLHSSLRWPTINNILFRVSFERATDCTRSRREELNKVCCTTGVIVYTMFSNRETQRDYATRRRTACRPTTEDLFYRASRKIATHRLPSYSHRGKRTFAPLFPSTIDANSLREILRLISSQLVLQCD